VEVEEVEEVGVVVLASSWVVVVAPVALVATMVVVEVGLLR
jgi:hypothetical protein